MRGARPGSVKEARPVDRQKGPLVRAREMFKNTAQLGKSVFGWSTSSFAAWAAEQYLTLTMPGKSPTLSWECPRSRLT